MAVAKTRAGGRWSESRFWGFLRSSLRRASVRWPPKADALRAARRAYKGPNKRRQYEYLCAECGGWFAGKEVEIDHIVPCGPLRSFGDLPGFCERLFVEQEGYQCICVGCHAEKTRKAKEQQKEDGK